MKKIKHIETVSEPIDFYPFTALISRVMTAPGLYDEDRKLIQMLLYEGNRVERAMTVERFFRLGYTRSDRASMGAYRKAGELCGCHASSARRAHTWLIEKLRGSSSVLGSEWKGQKHPIVDVRVPGKG